MSLTSIFDEYDQLASLIVDLPHEILLGARTGLKEFLAEFQEKYVSSTFVGGTPQSPSPHSDRVYIRSGMLRRSFGFFISNTNTIASTKATVGFGAIPNLPAPVYARIHEEGGVITPKKGQFLAIPWADNLNPSGLPLVDSPRKLANARFIPNFGKSGPSMLVFDGDRAMFILVRRVRIRPRLNFKKKFGRAVSRRMSGDMGRAMQRQLSRFAG